MMQNLGARLEYTEQYHMSSIITASCSLGCKHCMAMHACIHAARRLASQSQRVPQRRHMAWQLNMHTL